MTASGYAAHLGGSGSPLLLLHGFTDTWHTWELVLPALEAQHTVLAPTLAGHAGGPPFPRGEVGAAAALDAVEAAMDRAGFATAHVVGNSLGGYLAFRLAERGRARSIVAFAPAGGWDQAAERDRLLAAQRTMATQSRAFASQAALAAATPESRRRALQLIVEDARQIDAELATRLIAGVAHCTDAEAMIDAALRDGYPLDPAAVTCPVRIVWGTADRLLPWPSAAARFRRDWWHADWIELEGAGHAPQLQVPLEAAQLILGFTQD